MSVAAARRPGDGALVIYDGDCGFCRRFIAWTDHRDVVAFQRLSSAELLRLGVTRAGCERALQLVRADGTVLAGGGAVNALVAWRLPVLARLLGAMQSIAALSRAQELAYRAVAANRSRLSRLLGLSKSPSHP